MQNMSGMSLATAGWHRNSTLDHLSDSHPASGVSGGMAGGEVAPVVSPASGDGDEVVGDERVVGPAGSAADPADELLS